MCPAAVDRLPMGAANLRRYGFGRKRGRKCNPCLAPCVYRSMGVILLLLGGTGVIASIGGAIWLLDKRERLAQQQRHESAEAERALSERMGRPSGEA